MKVSYQGQTHFVDKEAYEAVRSIAVIKIQIACMPSPLSPFPLLLFQNSLAKITFLKSWRDDELGDTDGKPFKVSLY